MALANQQAVTNGKPLIGFINPAIYEIGNESVSGTAFFDITTGNNAWPGSPNAYYAVPGYDLCTGLGTPKGTNLINLLVAPDPLTVAPAGGFSAVETPAGAFNVVSQIFALTNVGSAAISWSLVSTSAWLTVSNSGGTLAAGASDQAVVSLNTVASNLIAGTYSSSLWFSNVTMRVGHSRYFTLQTSDPLVIQAPTSLAFFGPPNGPFTPATYEIALTNASSNALTWAANNSSARFTASPPGGSLPAGAGLTLQVAPAPAATNLADGWYTGALQVTNVTSGFVQNFPGVIDVGLVLNGGFETGDFTDWTLVGDTTDGTNVYDGVVSANSLADGTGPDYIHSGTYGAFLGDNVLATLSQNVPTTPGQNSSGESTNGSGPRVTGEKVGSNDPCPCGSGKKYKKCHGAQA